MNVEDGITLGELARRLDRIDSAVSALDHKVDGLSFVPWTVYNADKKAGRNDRAGLLERIMKLEGTNVWLVRTIGGALIVGIIGIAFALLSAR